MNDLILVLVLLAIIGGAVVYIIKAKKKGIKCIGCSSACSRCAKPQTGSCCGGCGTGEGSCSAKEGGCDQCENRCDQAE